MKLLICILIQIHTLDIYGHAQDSTYFWQLYEKGRFKCQASDFYDAKVFLENLLTEFRESDYCDYILEARIMTDISWAYSGLRDNVSENFYIKAALKIYVDNLKGETEEYAAALHEMALTQGERGNIQNALALLDSSNNIFKKYLPDLYPGSRVSNLVARGWMYREEGNYDKAINTLTEASKWVKEKGGDRYTEMGSIQHILGYTLMYSGDWEKALPHLLEGKRLRFKRLGPTHPKYHQSLLKVAECYSYLGIYQNAQEHLDTIIEALHGDDISNPEGIIQLDSIKSWYTLLQTYVNKGNIYLHKYRSNNDINQLELNLKWYKKAIDAVQKILLYYPTKEGRFQMLKGYGFLFDNCVNQAVLLYDHYQDPIYLEEAFQISEISRGYSFLESIHKTQVTNDYNVPKSLLEKESKINIQMQKYEIGIDGRPQNSQEWIRLNLELQKIQQRLKKEFPDYFDLKSNLVVPTIKEVQQKIQKNDVVIEFYESRGKLFTFLISKDSATVHTIKNQKEYNVVLSRLVNTISKNPLTSNKSLERLQSDSKLIYNWLITPIEPFLSLKQNIVFIPHKKLNYLPLETLVNEDTITHADQYLIQSFAVSYGYSCTSLFSEKKEETNCKYPYHGIAPGIREDDSVDESINEIRHAYQLWGGKFSLNKNANRKNLLIGLKKADIVHVAAHSILDTSDISKFAIILNNAKTANKKDSFWIEDIYLSEINSSLIILSGCQTADGLLKEGEGLLSLTNAFKYAGAKSLTCSLWKTENSTSNEIISDYIINLNNGKSKDQALRLAKLRFIEEADPLLKHPFFWSTFVNVGNQDPIEKMEIKIASPIFFYLLAFSFLLFSLVFLTESKKKI